MPSVGSPAPRAGRALGPAAAAGGRGAAGRWPSPRHGRADWRWRRGRRLLIGRATVELGPTWSGQAVECGDRRAVQASADRRDTRRSTVPGIRQCSRPGARSRRRSRSPTTTRGTAWLDALTPSATRTATTSASATPPARPCPTAGASRTVARPSVVPAARRRGCAAAAGAARGRTPVASTGHAPPAPARPRWSRPACVPLRDAGSVGLSAGRNLLLIGAVVGRPGTPAPTATIVPLWLIAASCRRAVDPH